MGQREVELLARIDQDAPAQQLVTEPHPPPLVGGEGVAVASQWPGAEEHLRHRAVADSLHRQTYFLPEGIQLGTEGVPDPVQPVVDSVGSEGVERGEARRRPDGIAVERAADPSIGRLPAPAGPGQVEHVAAPADGGDREAAGKSLPQRAEIGNHVVALLRAAPGQPEARHDLIEDQERAARLRQRPQAGQETGLRAQGALERLDDDRR